MTRRARIWRVVAALFVLLNIAGVGIAAVGGEVLHTAAHVALALLGAYAVWRLGPRAGERALPDAEPAEQRLEHIRQSVDAIAIEVERIGEAQRFDLKLQQEKGRSVR